MSTPRQRPDEPSVQIDLKASTLWIGQVLETCYLIEAEGALDAQIVVLGDEAEAAAVARALAEWMGRR